MNYIQLTICINEAYQEPLIAELDAMDFDGFEQLEGQLIAFIGQTKFTIGQRERINQILSVYPGDNFIEEEQVVEDQNWNKKWEETIQPIEVGQFLIKPTWSNKKAKGKIVLEIDPKMAFGTGYHATTRLMLRELPKLISPNIKVLDAGTGTGILSIAAVKLGAGHVTAFDYDEWSVQNTEENLRLNDTFRKVEVRLGSMEVINLDEKFEVILANINKNMILEMLDSFQGCLNNQGKLLISGLLKTDENEVMQGLNEAGFKPKHVAQEAEWIAILAEK